MKSESTSQYRLADSQAGRPSNTNTITIVLPNRNHARFLAQSLQAILRQTRPADQIIIIDDGSTDNSIEIIEHTINGHPSAELIRMPQSAGVVSAMNLGLMRATGTFVAMLAADDVVFPDFLERSAALLERHTDAAFSCAGTEVWDELGNTTGARPFLRPSTSERFIGPQRVRELLRRGDNFFLGPSTLFRRSKIMDMGAFDEALSSSSDGILQRRMAVRWGFCFIPHMLAAWRVHGSNYSSSSVTDPERLDGMLARILEELRKEPSGLFPEGYGDQFERRLRFGACRLVATRLPNDPEAISRISRCLKASEGESRLLSLLGHTGWLAPHLVLSFLAIRNRPFSLRWVIFEGLCRLLPSIKMRTRKVERIEQAV